MSVRLSLASCWFPALILIAASGVHADPLRFPKRMMNGQVADLGPLFRWWTNHNETRPLTAWVHLSGSIIGTNSWGWVLEARVEGAEGPAERQAKIILENPPLQDRAQFEKLVADSKALQQQRAQLLAQETQARTRASALSKEQRASGRNRARARAAGQEASQSRQAESQAKEQLKPVESQLEELKKKLARYPNSEHYAVDCFALDTHQKTAGVRVYDHGLGFQ